MADLSPEDIVDHYALFGVVAGRAAALAAETIDEEGLAELRKVHARFPHAGSDGAALGPEDLQQLNHDFHRIINLTAPGRTRWLLRHLEHSVPSNYYEFADGWNHAAVEHQRRSWKPSLAATPMAPDGPWRPTCRPVARPPPPSLRLLVSLATTPGDAAVIAGAQPVGRDDLDLIRTGNSASGRSLRLRLLAWPRT
ncbi:MAG: hypothetical protein Ct9H300mP12_13910 [Acidimicrobiales bacterium]|nr:MAG: hypothetical protein Ct9H300mP12_13910 [Acidimicrobiales bacterium]